MAAANTQDGVSDDLNYEMWAPTAKTTLVEKGLWDVVENGVPPDPTKIPELAATIKVADLAHWRNLVMRDIKALKIMQASLTESAFRKTISASSAKELWGLLEKGKEEAKLRRLEKQFEELRMYEGESIDSYTDRVTEVVEQLRLLKNEKSDYEVVKKVLASLSGSYSDAAPLLGELIDRNLDMNLKSLVEFFRTYDSISEEDVRLMLRLNRLKYESAKWCGVCNKNGHNQEECLYSNSKAGDSSGGGASEGSLRGGGYIQRGEYVYNGGHCFRRNQKPAGTKAQNQTDQEEEMLVDYVLLANSELSDFTYDEDMWMIYGHATIHMTPYEKLFTTLDRTHKAKVGLVDGTVVMAEGIGDVKIVMKEGKKKTINNVLYVPRGINRNVLSIPQMNSRGCSLKPGERGECIVRDRTGAVFGDTTWDERGLSIRLQVIEGNLTS